MRFTALVFAAAAAAMAAPAVSAVEQNVTVDFEKMTAQSGAGIVVTLQPTRREIEWRFGFRPEGPLAMKAVFSASGLPEIPLDVYSAGVFIGTYPPDKLKSGIAIDLPASSLTPVTHRALEAHRQILQTAQTGWTERDKADALFGRMSALLQFTRTLLALDDNQRTAKLVLVESGIAPKSAMTGGYTTHTGLQQQAQYILQDFEKLRREVLASKRKSDEKASILGCLTPIIAEVVRTGEASLDVKLQNCHTLPFRGSLAFLASGVTQGSLKPLAVDLAPGASLDRKVPIPSGTTLPDKLTVRLSGTAGKDSVARTITVGTASR